MNIKVTKNNQSSIDAVDFSNLPFGEIHTDHMMVCDYANGKWGDLEIKPFESFTLSPSTSCFHYGQAIFEGMKAYKNKNGKAILFRPEENIKRFNQSAERMMMPNFPEATFLDALQQLIDMDRDWIPSEDGQSLYIRPTMIATEPTVKARHSMDYKMFVICFPVSLYYDQPLKVKIETKYSRATVGGVGEAKCAGNYAGSFYPVHLAQKQGYDQVIWTDSSQHKIVEEAGTMNLMFRIGNILVTPSLSGTILHGITRKSVIEVAKDKGIEVEERDLSIIEILEAYNKGILKEAFGVGTAAIVSSIKQLDLGDIEIILQEQKDSYATLLKKEMKAIQTGEVEDKFDWLRVF